MADLDERHLLNRHSQLTCKGSPFFAEPLDDDIPTPPTLTHAADDDNDGDDEIPERDSNDGNNALAQSDEAAYAQPCLGSFFCFILLVYCFI